MSSRRKTARGGRFENAGRANVSNFARRLPDKGMAVLERLTSKRSGWWPDLLASWAPSGSPGELRLAIRNGYMNFYSNGQSIARITFGRGGTTPTMHIHEKYVKKISDGGQRYVTLTDKEGRNADGRPVTWGGPEMLKEWVRNSCKHSGKEKRHIESLVQQSPRVIDLEMGLPAFGDRKTALRMDLVSLESTRDDIRLVFWEAKMIGDSRLRSITHQPKVFEQINAYRSYLADPTRKAQVAKAYQQCCGIIHDLYKLASCVGMTHPLDPLIKAAADPSCRLEIEETPRLVVFEDGKPRVEDAWQTHLKVLCHKASVTIIDKSSIGVPLELIPRCGG